MATLPRRIKFEYRSKEGINGWPLIHINVGANPKIGQAPVAKGVVAIGNIAYGIVSIGAVAFGIVTLAGFGLGLVSLAGFAVGIIALGAVALGYEYALGVVVQSVKYAVGVINLDYRFVIWPLMLAAIIALIIWKLANDKADQPRS